MAQAHKGTRKLFSLRLPNDLHRQLNAFAGIKNAPVGDIIIGWVRAAWEAQPEKETIIKLISADEAKEAKGEPGTPKKAAPKAAAAKKSAPKTKAR
jgi:hypothetical protein